MTNPRNNRHINPNREYIPAPIVQLDPDNQENQDPDDASLDEMIARNSRSHLRIRSPPPGWMPRPLQEQVPSNQGAVESDLSEEDDSEVEEAVNEMVNRTLDRQEQIRRAIQDQHQVDQAEAALHHRLLGRSADLHQRLRDRQREHERRRRRRIQDRIIRESEERVRRRRQAEDEARIRSHRLPPPESRARREAQQRTIQAPPRPINIPPGVPVPGMMTERQFEEDLQLLQHLCDAYRAVGMRVPEVQNSIVQLIASRRTEWYAVAHRLAQDQDRARRAQQEALQHNQDALAALREGVNQNNVSI